MHFPNVALLLQAQLRTSSYTCLRYDASRLRHRTYVKNSSSSYYPFSLFSSGMKVKTLSYAQTHYRELARQTNNSKNEKRLMSLCKTLHRTMLVTWYLAR